MTPVAFINGPTKVLRHETAAAIKLIDLLTLAIIN